VAIANQNGLAIIAGRGDLPKLLAQECRATGRAFCVVRLPGVALDWASDAPLIEARFEKLGALFAAMRNNGCGDVVFAGGVDRPNFRPEAFDAKTLEIAPKLLPKIGKGDDTTLRAIAEVFENEGFVVVGADKVLAGLSASSGAMGAHHPSDEDSQDINRAVEVVAALGKVDVGQGAVVAQGLCLGLESLQGTDKMLEFVAQTGKNLRPVADGAKGVLFKGVKPGQDRRMDMPAIGPATIKLASAAGLAGVAVQAGGVLVLERDQTIKTANQLGLFLFGVV
jgi:UDP-2,3-diacylglucosamine hydrolase